VKQVPLTISAVVAICSAGSASALDSFDLESKTKEACATSAAHPTWRGSFETCQTYKEHAKAIAEGKVLLGMWDSEVIQAWHKPEHIESMVTIDGDSRERWFYPGGNWLEFWLGNLVAIHTNR
jgi:hypothetical protein